MRKITTLIAIALIAAACGGDGETASTLETLEEASSDTMPPITTGSTAASEDSAALPESDYPDVVVADLAGGEVNLRELALETEPVLLWFWAPH